jgi:hypothetical protein
MVTVLFFYSAKRFAGLSSGEKGAASEICRPVSTAKKSAPAFVRKKTMSPRRHERRGGLVFARFFAVETRQISVRRDSFISFLLKKRKKKHSH